MTLTGQYCLYYVVIKLLLHAAQNVEPSCTF